MLCIELINISNHIVCLSFTIPIAKVTVNSLEYDWQKKLLLWTRLILVKNGFQNRIIKKLLCISYTILKSGNILIFHVCYTVIARI